MVSSYYTLKDRCRCHSTRLLLTLAVLGILMALQLACGNDKPSDKPVVIAIGTDSFTTSDGMVVYYDVHSLGDTTLLFVHCWSCDRSYWDGQIPAFKDSFGVVTIDLAGHGQSSLGRQSWDMDAYGSDVAALMEKLNLSNVILVGHSMGGAVIIEAARQAPDRVLALIGVDNLQSMRERFSPEQQEQFLAPLRSDFASTTRGFVRQLFMPWTDTVISYRIADDMASAPPEVAVPSISSLLNYDMATALQTMRKPIWCINSSRNPTDVEGNRQVAASFGLFLMDGTGHFPHLEQPQKFNRLLNEAIDRLAAQR